MCSEHRLVKMSQCSGLLRRRFDVEKALKNAVKYFKMSTFDVDPTSIFQRVLLDVEKVSKTVEKSMSKFQRPIDVEKSTVPAGIHVGSEVSFPGSLGISTARRMMNILLV